MLLVFPLKCQFGTHTLRSLWKCLPQQFSLTHSLSVSLTVMLTVLPQLSRNTMATPFLRNASLVWLETEFRIELFRVQPSLRLSQRSYLHPISLLTQTCLEAPWLFQQPWGILPKREQGMWSLLDFCFLR